MRTWSQRKVLVLGLGESGLSMLRWLHGQGALLTAADSRANPPNVTDAAACTVNGKVACGPFSDDLFADIDCIAISPGVPLRDPHVARALARGVEVVGDIELLARSLPASTPVLAITGANGKTTVTTLVTHLCCAAGLDAVAAGNISPAVLDVVLQRGARQPALWVLELSSFQLETTSSLRCAAATVLNVTEDHMDRYDGMDDYAAAKARIFAHAVVQVLNRDDGYSMNMRRDGAQVVSFGLETPPPTAQDFGIERAADGLWLVRGTQRLLPASALQLTGLHNVANALAALALCTAAGLPLEKLLPALTTFKGLPHRVEYVTTVNGVRYYDDSKGTNVGATVAALQGLGLPVVLIAGGDGKGQDFSPLCPVVTQHARAVLLIGRDGPRLADTLRDCGVPLHFAADLPAAVQHAAALAQPGEAVLLSPACASLDMFRNYAHRAEVFIAAVRQLPGASDA